MQVLQLQRQYSRLIRSDCIQLRLHIGNGTRQVTAGQQRQRALIDRFCMAGSLSACSCTGSACPAASAAFGTGRDGCACLKPYEQGDCGG